MAGSDIFISYKSEQFSWAARLARDLRRHGFTVFLDQDTQAGLRSGEAWELQLAEEIREAKHFLLLASTLITVGSYVTREIKIRQDADGDITVIRLDDQVKLAVLNDAIQDFGQFVELVNDHPTADDVPYFAWHQAVRHLVESAPLSRSSGSAVVEIPTVVVAMTAAQATELAAGTNVVAAIQGDTYERMIALLNQSTPLDPARYGARPEDWQPFAPVLDPSDPTVEAVIDKYDDAQRRWHQDHPEDTDDTRCTFVPYGDALRNAATRSRARERLKARPSLIVFDPVSLMHQAVNAFVVSNGLHTLTKAFVIGLGPQLSTSSQSVVSYLGEVESELFEGLMMADPRDRSRSMFHPTLSTCVLNVNHQFELSRWLQIASEGILGWDERSRTRMAPEYRAVVRAGPTLPRL